ncbi:hypothetical protein BVRB_008750 [Beta vulgaris subsp. vulgaris]|uniref:Uncharacterized protein n=1 Tax=Beta vulgaris subsp. vulgaris TaxID=3555 RepID=A0A0J8B6G0_BETVV|nr:hypothetical protein BVRB_008750 [Beta vulgaris subsp. vulgaris]
MLAQVFLRPLSLLCSFLSSSFGISDILFAYPSYISESSFQFDACELMISQLL